MISWIANQATWNGLVDRNGSIERNISAVLYLWKVADVLRWKPVERSPNKSVQGFE